MVSFDDYKGLEVRGFLETVPGQPPAAVKGHITKYVREGENCQVFEVELDNGETYPITAMVWREGELAAPGEFPHHILKEDDGEYEAVGTLDVHGVKLGYETRHSWAGIPISEQEDVVVFDTNTHEVVTPEQWDAVMGHIDEENDTIFIEVLPVNEDMSMQFNRHIIHSQGTDFHWDMVPGWFVPDPDAESGYREDPSLKED